MPRLPNYLSCLICVFVHLLYFVCVPLIGGKCASPGPVIGPEKGWHWDPLPFCHTHHLCREQPWDTQGDMGKLEAGCCTCELWALTLNTWSTSQSRWIHLINSINDMEAAFLFIHHHTTAPLRSQIASSKVNTGFLPYFVDSYPSLTLNWLFLCIWITCFQIFLHPYIHPPRYRILTYFYI